MTLDKYDIDDDYIDVGEPQRADISVSWSDSATSESATIESETMTFNTDESDNPSRSTDQVADAFEAHSLSSEVGDGAHSWGAEQIDQHGFVANDGRSQTVTKFYADEAADGDQQQYRRLAKLNDGMRSPERRSQNQAADRKRYIETFCSRLDMSPYHTERITIIESEINMSHMAHFSSQQTILGIVSLVANEDNWFIRDDETFRDLMDGIGVTLKELRTIRQLIREKAESI